MSVTVKVPNGFSKDKREFYLDIDTADTVFNVLQKLPDDVKKHVFDENNNKRTNINIYLNREVYSNNIRMFDDCDFQDKVEDGNIISIYLILC